MVYNFDDGLTAEDLKAAAETAARLGASKEEAAAGLREFNKAVAAQADRELLSRAMRERFPLRWLWLKFKGDF